MNQIIKEQYKPMKSSVKIRNSFTIKFNVLLAGVIRHKSLDDVVCGMVESFRERY